MWMTPKYMIMITRTKSRLTDRARTNHNQELLNTTRRTAMVIKINSMGDMGKNIILTAILRITTTEGKRMTMTCGDCNVDGMVAHFSCFYAYTMEYWALFTSGWMEVQWLG